MNGRKFAHYPRVGQRVERRDRDEDWGIGYVTSVHPLRVTYGEDHEVSDEGYEWEEVRALPKTDTAAFLRQEMQSDTLRSQRWAEKVHRVWSIGAVVVILLGACLF